MGNGNIDVGNETPTRKPGQPKSERLSGRTGSSDLRIDPSLKTGRQEKPSANRSENFSENAPENSPGICGAMSQQGGEFRGNVSAPQKFVHLVGCREPKAGSGLEARRYSNPAKR